MKKNELLLTTNNLGIDACVFFHGLDKNGNKLYRVCLDSKAMEKYKSLDKCEKVGKRANYDKNYVLTSCYDYKEFTQRLIEKIYCGNWVNIEDVNPLDHGGLWVKKDTSKGCYSVVRLSIDEYVNDEYCIQDMYIDLNASWINWDDVKNCGGVSTYNNDYEKIQDLLGYYSSYEFGCYDGEKFELNKNIARKKLNERNIHIAF